MQDANFRKNPIVIRHLLACLMKPKKKKSLLELDELNMAWLLHLQGKSS